MGIIPPLDSFRRFFFKIIEALLTTKYFVHVYQVLPIVVTPAIYDHNTIDLTTNFMKA